MSRERTRFITYRWIYIWCLGLRERLLREIIEIIFMWTIIKVLLLHTLGSYWLGSANEYFPILKRVVRLLQMLVTCRADMARNRWPYILTKAYVCASNKYFYAKLYKVYRDLRTSAAITSTFIKDAINVCLFIDAFLWTFINMQFKASYMVLKSTPIRDLHCENVPNLYLYTDRRLIIL